MKFTVAPDPDSLARTAAARIAAALWGSDRPSLVLAGGSTPRRAYERLAELSRRERVPWGSTGVFWGDERMVGPDHADSNYRMCEESLLRHVGARSVHRIQGELTAEEAAQRYEDAIRRAFSLGPADWPRFTLVLLGLGVDGHTASLFPGTSVLGERRRIAAPVYVPRLDAHRVTLTVPAIAHAGEILVLVSGRDKAPVVREVLEAAAGRHPIERIVPHDGRIEWLLDAEAASLLQGTS